MQTCGDSRRMAVIVCRHAAEVHAGEIAGGGRRQHSFPSEYHPSFIIPPLLQNIPVKPCNTQDYCGNRCGGITVDVFPLIATRPYNYMTLSYNIINIICRCTRRPRMHFSSMAAPASRGISPPQVSLEWRYRACGCMCMTLLVHKSVRLACV